MSTQLHMYKHIDSNPSMSSGDEGHPASLPLPSTRQEGRASSRRMFFSPPGRTEVKGSLSMKRFSHRCFSLISGNVKSHSSSRWAWHVLRSVVEARECFHYRPSDEMIQVASDHSLWWVVFLWMKLDGETVLKFLFSYAHFSLLLL